MDVSSFSNRSKLQRYERVNLLCANQISTPVIPVEFRPGKVDIAIWAKYKKQY